MAFNPNILEETGLSPILASGAITAKRAVVATTPDSAARQRGKMADAVGQNVAIASVPRFLGVSPDAIADAAMGSIQRRGRCRAEGGGAITAPALVTFDASGKFVTYTHDATKFGMIVGYAASDCGGDGQFFDLVLDPSFIPATTGQASRQLGAQGADVASANNLVLGSDGNVFEITGATQINLISNLNWQNGAEITLLFTAGPTVKHNQATATTNITIQLAGAADFVATAGDVLTLVLSEIGGTQAWRETGRSVI